jgi:hypothetical protein
MLARNKQTGAVEEFSEEQLPDIVKSGAYDVEARKYEFEDDLGERRLVDPTGLKKAMDLGYKLITQDQIKKEELQKKYGDQPIKSLGLGIAGGVSLGLIPAGLEATGIVPSEEMGVLKDSGFYTAGEVGGAILSIGASGGSGIAAKVASKLPTAILAKGASKAGTRIAQNITSDIAKKAVALGAEGGIEGGVYGGVTALTEEALGDHEFNAEAVLYKAGTGALFGAGIGAPLGASIGAIKRVAGKSSASIQKFIKGSDQLDKDELANALAKADLIQAGEDALISAGKGKDEVLAVYDQVGIKPSWFTGAQDQAFKETVGSVAKGPTIPGKAIRNELERTHNVLDNMSSSILTGKAKVDPNDLGEMAKKSITEIMDSDPGLNMARTLYAAREEFATAPITVPLRKRDITILSKHPVVKFSSEAQGILGDIGKIETIADTGIVKSKIAAMMRDPSIRADGNLVKFLGEAKDKVETLAMNSLKYNAKYGPFKNKADQIQAAIDGFKTADALYKQAHKEYGFLKHIFATKTDNITQLRIKVEQLDNIQIARRIENIKDVNVLRQFEGKFPEVYATYRANRLNKIAEKSLHDGKFSTKKFIKEMKGLNKSELAQLFPGVKNIAGLIDNMEVILNDLPPFINKSSTAYEQNLGRIADLAYQGKEALRYALLRGGEDGLYKYLNKALPNLAGVEQASNSVKNQIVTASNGFSRILAPSIAIAAVSRPSEDKLNKAEKTYKILQENPEQLVENYLNQNRDLMDAAPRTGQALQQKMIAAASFLQSKMPKNQSGYIGQTRQPNKIELTQFADYVEAVESPRKVLSNISKGYVSPSQIEALKTVYPSLYAAMQAEVMNRLPKKLTRYQQSQLQVLLGAMVTPAMSRAGFGMLQGQQAPSKVEELKQSSAKPTMTGLSKVELANRNSSSLDKVVNRRA